MVIYARLHIYSPMLDEDVMKNKWHVIAKASEQDLRGCDCTKLTIFDVVFERQC
jgi:hypothetical protein